MKIIKKTTIPHNGMVIDLSVKNSHTYNVEGLGVHNSAGGCLTSRLLGITDIDPVKYELFFERFYNAGRNSPGKVAYPDIDVDFPVHFRGKVFDHIREVHGHDKVAQVATFMRLQGKAVIRAVFRSLSDCPLDIIDVICKRLPEESKVADKMEADEETSLIMWTLKNEPSRLSDFCEINEDGEIEGEFAEYFKKAIEVEGTFKSYGKHASALIISDKVMMDNCPMFKDKNTGVPLSAVPYEWMEQMGFIKFDILGLRTLDVLEGVACLLLNGRIDFDIDDDESEDDEDD